MGPILTASMHVSSDVPIDFHSGDADFVTVRLGDPLTGVLLVVHEVADVDRLTDTLAVVRAELVTKAMKATA